MTRIELKSYLETIESMLVDMYNYGCIIDSNNNLATLIAAKELFQAALANGAFEEEETKDANSNRD